MLFCRILPTTVDPHHRNNRPIDDAIATALHSAVTHLDTRNSHVRRLFVDYTVVQHLTPYSPPYSTAKQVMKMGSNISTPPDQQHSCPPGLFPNLSPLLPVHQSKLSAVERIDSIRFPGVQLTNDLTWAEHTNQVGRNAQQCLFHIISHFLLGGGKGLAWGPRSWGPSSEA